MGIASTNRPQIVNLSGALSTPNFNNRFLRAAVTGWQISPILQASSGAPLNFLSGRDVVLDGSSSGQRLNLVGDPTLANPTTS